MKLSSSYSIKPKAKYLEEKSNPMKSKYVGSTWWKRIRISNGV